MTTFTNGTDVITPTLIEEYESRSEHRNIVHPILGSEQVDVVLRPATLRAGSMSLVIEGDAAAAAAEAALRKATVWALVDARETVDMTFVVQGSVTRALDDADDTRTLWLVGFDWQEVTP